jgi:hypothetical protein
MSHLKTHLGQEMGIKYIVCMCMFKIYCHTKTGGSDPVWTLDVHSRSVCGGRFLFLALINLAWGAWIFSFWYVLCIENGSGSS